MTEKLIKSKKRVKDLGEVFTPVKVVKEMCDNIEKEYEEYVFSPDKTFLEPACGTGNFLIEILERKLARCKDWNDVLTSIQSIYGVDIMSDNVEESRKRMFELAMKIVLEKNIIVGDFLKICDKLDDYFIEWKKK